MKSDNEAKVEVVKITNTAYVQELLDQVFKAVVILSKRTTDLANLMDGGEEPNKAEVASEKDYGSGLIDSFCTQLNVIKDKAASCGSSLSRLEDKLIATLRDEYE